jgi:hypothetical protein
LQKIGAHDFQLPDFLHYHGQFLLNASLQVRFQQLTGFPKREQFGYFT